MNLAHIKRTKAKRKVPYPRLMVVPDKANSVWTMDFVSDVLTNGRKLRSLNIIDQFTRFCPGIYADNSISGEAVTRFLDDISLFHGLPHTMQVDNGPEFTSKAFVEWCYRKNIKLQFITPGKPVENAFIESFNDKFRRECLNMHLFPNLEDARSKIEEWRILYNEFRPHRSIGGITPAEFMKQNSENMLCA